MSDKDLDGLVITHEMANGRVVHSLVETVLDESHVEVQRVVQRLAS